MSKPLRCERCGGPLPQGGVLRGRCPRCMVEVALSLADEAPPMVGERLGHYRVSALAGSGGMGAVWKARDTRLDRDVAIKTLPAEELDRLGERRARLEREAKLLASLNHPNIAAIHGLEEDQGTCFLVLEFVEGETLAARLRRGAIPLEESLKLARQIADALEGAHEKGVTHRDLKPANIMITNDGIVKVLDFGLAKAFVPEDPGADTTEPGIVLGTADYMAPEQTRGMKVDRRADIWAFGVVLYEMVTGTRPFQGTDRTETMASVVMKEPDFEAAPAPIRRLLRKCLEKDPKNRLRDIGDAWELLNDSFPATNASRARARQRDARLPWIVASLLAVTTLVLSLFTLKRPPLPEVTRLPIHAPRGSTLPYGTPAISRSGRAIAFTVQGPDDLKRIHVLASDSVTSKPLRGTEGADHPFWFDDDGSLGFVVGDKLKRIDLATESVRTVGEMIGGFAWQATGNQYGDILARSGGGLVHIAARGGTSKEISDSFNDTHPEFLSDGRRYLVLNRKEGSIQLLELGSTKRNTILNDVRSAPILARTPSGRTYLLFLDGADLMAQEFDEHEERVLGRRHVLAPGVKGLGNPPVRPAVGVSPNRLVYQSAGEETTLLRWVDRMGQPIHTFSPSASLLGPRLSRDEMFAVGQRNTGGVDIWVTNLRQERSENMTRTEDARELFPVWSSNSKQIAYRDQDSRIYAIDVDGGGTPIPLTKTRGVPMDWYGQYLLYGNDEKIYLLDVSDPAREAIPAGSRHGKSHSARFSFDGKYIAFVSNGSEDREEVYIRQAPPGALELQVSRDGGSSPKWKGDGTEVFFMSRDGALMGVKIQPGNSLSAGTPYQLFPGDRWDADERGGTGYDVGRSYEASRNGQKFLAPWLGEVNAPITVVENWWIELEKKRGR